MQLDPPLAVWERALLGDPEAVVEHERLLRASEPEPAGDILDRIDATVEAVESCGCGCGRRLDPSGPSPFFASDACQRRYHERHANDPGEVLNRPDVASVHPGYDDLPVPLREGHRRGHPLAAGSGCSTAEFVAAVVDFQRGNLAPEPATWPPREAICSWLRANDIDPTVVPLDSEITVQDGVISYEVYQITDGRIAVANGAIVRRSAATPLREPLLDGCDVSGVQFR